MLKECEAKSYAGQSKKTLEMQSEKSVISEVILKSLLIY